MKKLNLKKLSRESQKEILGSIIRLQKCQYHFECPGGSCCHRVCVAYACPEL
ncbi:MULTISPECIES: bacteriocin-like protein [unclassified Chryseobacterium]|uniref:bacteriocin-like protein n=1 Tax=unclassified Chryseobacterium TaxID=2593645 RepID=UPI000B31FDFE|nr:hypothetical protein [Chryseobacterium sp. S0630]MCP1298884.1 hypothetical protein [Chryseobacterium sp. S0630]